MTNDYGNEIQPQPLYVTIPDEDYKYLCWCRNNMERLHPVHTTEYKRKEKYHG